MHYEILVEGQCELTALSILMPRIVGQYNNPNTWIIHKHRGIGSISNTPDLRPSINDNSLLGQLPAKLRAYSKTQTAERKVIVLLDLDSKDPIILLQELHNLIALCDSGFNAYFQFATEELEAWYLGDINALVAYNPKISRPIITGYVQDSICGTWEILMRADESKLLKLKKRDRRLLDKKVDWAKKIPPHMDINNNISPSFASFLALF